MNIVFMGTPDFAVPSLLQLLEHDYNVVGVVTQPDRPKGRKRVLTPPPVKEAALKAGLPVMQPVRLRNPEAVAALAEWQPDLIVTAAYGQILPKEVLDMPRLGCINVHASLLPRYRGGAPIHHAIMNGESKTGVTIMYMAEGLDTGDMISQVEVPITEEDNAGTMFEKLAHAGAKLLIETLPDLIAGRAPRIPQQESEATYAPNITREQEKIDWSRSAREIFNQVRGLSPWPVAYTIWDGEVMKVWACKVLDASTKHTSHAPGTVLALKPEGIDVSCGSGVVRLTMVQPAGKKAMAAADFVRGGKMKEGTVLGI
ncbi:methionyl-tRNA formyltransferase [Insulibacter thermoxylanivorax]|uniref:Methionyl-tRNA formyltransferase n=1 Tax=Insulibacter thermoxylanivorax TaxID=2749268 RepID=A0A916QE81_9BACL|nr:methionyl-tRNA formyltransferase [Insulibacter thermoxylanivorax]GFR37798.1 methionyl-tRNA formyltransferase [Insulibacter thermoxylanivorax]